MVRQLIEQFNLHEEVKEPERATTGLVGQQFCMRKLPIFGKHDAPISFEWPNKQIFEAMPADICLRVITVKVSAPGNNAFGSVKLTLSNGMESPEFNVPNTNWRVIKDLIIEPGLKVKKITANARGA